MSRSPIRYMRALAVLGLACVASACSVDLAPNTTNCPPLEDFQAVSPLLEQRCGTLDCHGNDARPLRLYGQNGLRFVGDEEDPDLYSGNLAAPTTPQEVERNYFAVCGLEPEKMVAVSQGEDPDTLTLVRKARLTEKHKGGRIWDKGKIEDRCLVGWLTTDLETPGEMNTKDCEEAAGL